MNNKREIEVNDQLTLLLIFKDDLPRSGQQGFPLVTESASIESHVIASQNQEKPKPAQMSLKLSLNEVSKIKLPKVQDIPENCFVWGWWRKPWEKHPKLLQYFAEQAKDNKISHVLLYNKYIRRIYKAKLHGLYYVPNASTVEMPPSWSYRCPEYYSKNAHFCGAYFLLEILKNEEGKIIKLDPTDVLQKYYFDALSFDFDSLAEFAIISPPEGTAEICLNLIDKKPDPRKLLLSQHSMFALRIFTQKELVRKFINENASDEIVADAIKKMSWPDIKWLINNFNIDEWARIIQLPHSIKSISNVLNRSFGGPIRLDIFLVAWAIANHHVFENLFFDENHDLKLSDIGVTLVKWLMTEDIFEQRRVASQFFDKVWVVMRKRYQLLDFTDYFQKLPEFEEIAYSTKYGLKRKFYRDHLNHNIRAALLSAWLACNYFSKNMDPYNKTLVAFLSGLFHDIALPLSSYENTNQTLQEALETLNITRETRIASPIDRTKLKDILTIVALFASLPNLEKLQTTQVLFPWEQRDHIIGIANQKILFEEMICSMSDEHAILSAAIIFNAAAMERGGANKNFDVGMRQIIQAGSGENRTKEGLEFLNLIQSIALHDRKAASIYESAREAQPGVPTPLDFQDFPIPTLVAIADDLQEWGRPIGRFDETIVNDAEINLSSDAINVNYDLCFKESAIGSVSYSFLEHIFGKVRNLSQLKANKNSAVGLKTNISVNILFGEIKLFFVGGSPARIDFYNNGNDQIIIWPKKDPPRSLEMGAKRELYTIEQSKTINGQNKNITSDFLIIEGEEKLREKLKAQIEQGSSLISFSTDGNVIRIRTTKNDFQAKVLTYYFSRLSDKTVAGQKYKIPFEGKIGVLEMELTNSEPITQITSIGKHCDKNLHRIPHEHFLDLDWRFSWEACRVILSFTHNYCNDKDKLIGYLGCPSLALYHQYQGLSSDLRLLDKGHYAISKWCEKKLLNPEKIINYNVKNDLDRHLMHTFDMIILDPPWYEEYYFPFWRRALELIKPGGIIGISEYPGYDPKKIKKFSDLREHLIQRIGGKDFFASIEISYSIPAFESFWGKHVQFTYPALNAYRPAYMDFYQIAEPWRKFRESVDIPEDFLPQILELQDGHYLKMLKDIDFEQLSKNGIALKTRVTLDRYKGEPKNILGWSTNNTLVLEASNGNGINVRNESDLKNAVITFENNVAHL